MGKQDEKETVDYLIAGQKMYCLREVKSKDKTFRFYYVGYKEGINEPSLIEVKPEEFSYNYSMDFYYGNDGKYVLRRKMPKDVIEFLDQEIEKRKKSSKK